ncbi:hypothetical protein N2152v2_007046 [Parachlorella kessleri]
MHHDGRQCATVTGVGGLAFCGVWLRLEAGALESVTLALECLDNGPSEVLNQKGALLPGKRLTALGQLKLPASTATQQELQSAWQEAETALVWTPAAPKQRCQQQGCLPELIATRMEVWSGGGKLWHGEQWAFPADGFMGLAVSLMTDATWKGILEREDPASFKKANELYTKLKSKEPFPGKRWGGLMTFSTSNLPSQASSTAPQQSDSQSTEASEDGEVPGLLRKRNKRLESYLASLTKSNRYGYKPLGLEWDLWIHPTQPSKLEAATVDHGTAKQLIMQAVTTNLPGLVRLAKKAGVNQIEGYGVTPVFWLNAFGHALNTAVNGDRSKPLPLLGEQEQYYRLDIMVLDTKGGPLALPDLWDRVYVQASIDSALVVLPTARTRRAHLNVGQGCRWNEDMTFWPLPLSLEKTDLLLEVRGDPKGVRRDKALGMVRIPLAPLLLHNPELLDGKQHHLELELPVGPKQPRRLYLRSRREGILSPEVSAAEWPPGSRNSSTAASKAWHSQGEAGSDDDEADAHPAGLEDTDLGTITVRFRLEKVGVLAAAESIGITPAAAQTCAAMLPKPGGVYLDIKSAYSTPQDIQQFVSTMTGIGVHCKAVCSFVRRQLDVGGIADTVLFFHGISGLENSCDNGQVDRGQFVLFNGASFLTDLKPEALKEVPVKRVREVMEGTADYPVDSILVRRYIGLCETYGFAGGIYVQEPDASAAAVSALARLVAEHSTYFPLGFAYGHLSGLGINFPDQNGRGFASQQILEELQARKELSNKVMERIKQGQHRQASLATTIAWAHRIVHGAYGLNHTEQRTLVVLLSQVWPHRNLVKVVDAVGGIRTIYLKAFEHYLTGLGPSVPLIELIQLLRDRGVIALRALPEKVELAEFFCSPQLRGGSLSSVLQTVGLQTGMHKLAKEGVLCVLESCTQDELNQVLDALGGRSLMEQRLRGRRGSGLRRLQAMDDALQQDPTRPACVLLAVSSAKREGAGAGETEL